ncbi:hypothetical protein OJAV_G00195400 [Oryzias javanicus]|uniref:Uncharacterized protein n=1 Tax=Oryzias javanicus TaxID=123683 RepID=A0A3S2PQW9_ORYJA|nr:hypothetical protein OJAV_G00195400 [Oryzias javanicus]
MVQYQFEGNISCNSHSSTNIAHFMCTVIMSICMQIIANNLRNLTFIICKKQ